MSTNVKSSVLAHSFVRIPKEVMNAFVLRDFDQLGINREANVRPMVRAARIFLEIIYFVEVGRATASTSYRRDTDHRADLRERITTDANLIGWRDLLQSYSTQGQWSPSKLLFRLRR